MKDERVRGGGGEWVRDVRVCGERGCYERV